LPFDPKSYGSQVAEILALDGDGQRLIPLVSEGCSSEEARSILRKQKATDLFLHSRAPQAALGGLYLYFSCWSEAHETVQDIDSAEGSFWHAIVHRQEPDPGNSAYWFRQTGSHPVYPSLAAAAEQIAVRYPKTGFLPGVKWDPFGFIDFCESARRKPQTDSESLALAIQRAEWQLLFDFCARSGT